ncbi:hypothetical protein TNCV_4784371 [Trichonephila clavipes]|nr:hypothetical protein TNCV_4784371 [Trichonephila clavipes]
MARKRAENRERSLGFPGFVKPVFTKDSKPLGKRKRSLGNPYSPKEGEPPEGISHPRFRSHIMNGFFQDINGQSVGDKLRIFHIGKEGQYYT